MAADTVSEAAVARALLSRGGSAALATLEDTGGPFASYVITAPAADGSPLLLLSRLAVHTRNIAGRGVYFGYARGRTVPMVQHHGVTYALVGDLDERQLMRLAASARVSDQ